MANRMQSVVAKTAGKMKGIKARLEGLVGVFDTLAAEHGEVKVLMKALRDKPERKSLLWPEIRRELLSHERGEQRVVFPVLRGYEETRELAELHEQEAEQLEAMIEQIDTTESDDWKYVYDRLVDTVSHHAGQEEREMFPKALKAIGNAMAKELDGSYRAAKQQALQAV